jgi:hypothetical protein
MTEIVQHFSDRGDLAHVALLLWAIAATIGALFSLREFAAAARRFDDFVRELSRFNRRAQSHDDRDDR